MAWRRLGDKPLSEPMMVRLLTHICVTRPKWVNRISAVVVKTVQNTWSIVSPWEGFQLPTPFVAKKWKKRKYILFPTILSVGQRLNIGCHHNKGSDDIQCVHICGVNMPIPPFVLLMSQAIWCCFWHPEQYIPKSTMIFEENLSTDILAYNRCAIIMQLFNKLWLIYHKLQTMSRNKHQLFRYLCYNCVMKQPCQTYAEGNMTTIGKVDTSEVDSDLMILLFVSLGNAASLNFENRFLDLVLTFKKLRCLYLPRVLPLTTYNIVSQISQLCIKQRKLEVLV